MRKIAAGNWKMNGLAKDLAELEALAKSGPFNVDVLICPPATLIERAATIAGPVHIGGQDCHVAVAGANTGEISAAMLVDAGADHVILGHSERRTDNGETDEMVAAKATAGLAAGLKVIICVGETLLEREDGKTLEVIETQLAGSVPDILGSGDIVIAYEPVWAIGTGKVPTLREIGQVHGAIRSHLGTRFGVERAETTPILYGGSVKPTNADEIFAVEHVDGALVGGASLKAADFKAIIDALSR